MAATARLAAAAAHRCSRSASAIVRREVTDSHNLTIDGCTASRKAPILRSSFPSETFEAAGHSWRIWYHPNGSWWRGGAYMSFHLELSHGYGVHLHDDPVKFRFSLLDQAGNPVPKYSRWKEGRFFSSRSRCNGFANFVKWKDLEESGCLKDDRFTLRCEITVTRDCPEDDDDTDGSGGAAPPPSVIVPPSDLHQHLNNLLWKKQGTDVVIDVGAWATYDVHGWLLAARSPVFETELLAATKKSGDRGTIKIEGIEPRVFEAMLHFMYTGRLPETAEQETVEIAQGLLAAAHRYKLERLKLMCEEMLCEGIDVYTVGCTLAVAEQYGCRALKAACVEFIARPGNLKAVMETEGFEKIKANCPAVLMELMMKQLASVVVHRSY